MMKGFSLKITQLADRIVRRFGAYSANTHGSISVETVLIMPLMVWGLTAAATFTDAFRQQITLQRSMYIVGDLISRSQAAAVTPEYINGVFMLTRQINATRNPLFMRITLIGWDDDADELVVVWTNSVNAGSRDAMTNDVLNETYARIIPTITPGETLVLSEGWLDFTPIFNVGLPTQAFHEITLMRPRFALGVNYSDPEAPAPPPAWCEFVLDSCGM